MRLCRSPIRIAFALAVALTLTHEEVHAEADGPDFWAVKGVMPGDVLTLHAEPSASGKEVGRIPHDAHGLKNLGCHGGATFAQWQKMTPVERKNANQDRWCRIEFDGKQGWVASRFLKEN